MAKITIRAARVNAGYSQDDMADKLGISRSYYQKIESGQTEMRPVYFYGICQVCGLSTDDILLPSVSTKS